MTVADLRRMLIPGVRVRITNHYITREDHPCFGTRDEEIVKANGSTFTLSNPRGARPSPISWPRRDQLVANENGSVTILGGGIRQAADEPFLTIEVLT
jgi:hypothetical protein